ncbi:cupin domain-containing protein [Burkholderia gladioli]|nr:cupin domain-containing protein [Burkholderia gladioli]MBU9192409.1 cupin domain-containing protein [Burkholderia gladioli]
MGPEFKENPVKTTPILMSALLALGAALAGPANAAATESGSAAGAPAETVKPNFSHALPNLPGKSLTAVEVDYPPGGASRPHHHAHSAFIYAYVVSGHIASQVDGQPERVYGPGESFYEMPGAHHQVSRNASASEPAKLLAVFVVDSGDAPLTINDR